MRVLTSGDTLEERQEAIERLLRSDGRPTGIIALWAEHAEAARLAAAELDLEIGRDLEIVGWQNKAAAASEVASPRIVWSVAEMAEMAVARLEQRRANPNMPVSVSKIPVHLELS
jgi:DNA-binding LacI/PurR family transcriptional regulator